MTPITPENAGQRITDMLMECAERLGNFPRPEIDPRAWAALLIYAPSLRYDGLYEYASDNNLDYNELCRVVQAAAAVAD